MLIYPEHVRHLKADGFTNEQIRQVEGYCKAAEPSYRPGDNHVAVTLNGARRWASRPLAEILDQLRPGIWVDKPQDGKHRPECPCCGEHAAHRKPKDEPTRKLWSQLEEKLLAIGGRRVVWPGVDHALEALPALEVLLARGRFFEQPVRFLVMPVNLSAENAALLWAKDTRGTKIALGYGLYEDCLWRAHAWAVKNGELLETHMPMEKHFGIELNQDQSVRVWFSQYFHPRYPKPGPAAVRYLDISTVTVEQKALKTLGLTMAYVTGVQICANAHAHPVCL